MDGESMVDSVICRRFFDPQAGLTFRKGLKFQMCFCWQCASLLTAGQERTWYACKVGRALSLIHPHAKGTTNNKGTRQFAYVSTCGAGVR